MQGKQGRGARDGHQVQSGGGLQPEIRRKLLFQSRAGSVDGHHGDALGRRLLIHVQDIMRTGEDIPAVREEVGVIGLDGEGGYQG